MSIMTDNAQQYVLCAKIQSFFYYSYTVLVFFVECFYDSFKGGGGFLSLKHFVSY